MDLTVPSAANAEVHVLFAGYVRDGGRVASTVGYVRDDDRHIIIDPGMVPHVDVIMRPLELLGVAPSDITDVVLSHHHPDHTLNAGLFGNARVHDHWAIYQGDLWISRDADRAEVSPSVMLARTPGHSTEDISTLVRSPNGLTVFTHLWWSAAGPADDPYTPDRAELTRHRRRLLSAADCIVPGHGVAFEPDQATPL